MKAAGSVLALAGMVMTLIASSPAQQSQSTLPALQPKRVVQDHFTDIIPVASTNVLEGALVGASDLKIVLDQLSTYVPDGHGQAMCLQVASRDGRYIGRFEYDISSQHSGYYGLVLATQWKSQLASYRASELAVLVVFKNDCSFLLPNDLVGVASWGDWSEPSHVTLFLNATRLDSRVFIPDEGRVYDCDLIDSPVKTAFDTKCQVIFSSLQRPSRLTVRLYRFESLQPEVPFRIAIP